MMRRLRLLAIPWILFAGCGDSDPVFLADAGPPDAQGTPDAMPCSMTTCGTACVDTSSDPLHCGGCNMACSSPAQTCQGSLPCECPAAFVPATVVGVFDTIDDSFLPEPLLAALSVYSHSSLTHAFTVGYDPDDTPTGEEIVLSAALEAPGVGVGYDVNVFNMSVRSGYVVSEGTLELTAACATGIAGTVTGATFVEMGLDGQVIDGGCSFAAESVSFDIGSCPDDNGDPSGDGSG